MGKSIRSILDRVWLHHTHYVLKIFHSVQPIIYLLPVFGSTHWLANLWIHVILITAISSIVINKVYNIPEIISAHNRCLQYFLRKFNIHLFIGKYG